MYRDVGMSDEERAANKLGTVFSNFNLDLESLGYYISRVLPKVVFDRVMITFDAADFYKAGGDIDEFNRQERI